MRANGVPVALRERLGIDATSGLVEFIEDNRQEWVNQVMSAHVDKFERRLVEVTSALRVEMHEGFAAMRSEASQRHAEMVKWAFLFWVGQGMWTAGLVFAATKMMK